MALPTLVLVHGGGLAADSWELAVEELNRIAPELNVLAPDLPGRRNKPGDLPTLTLADCVQSVVDDIADAGLDDIVLVGHSLAGLTVPSVVAKLGSSKVREMILATAFVPPEGTSLADTLTGPFAPTARRNAKRGGLSQTPSLGIRFLYLNGVPRARRKFMADKVHPESARILGEKVSRQGMPDDVPRTWILTLRDRALSPKMQRQYIDALGGVQTLIEVDTCHCLMISEPERLAEILIERCRLYDPEPPQTNGRAEKRRAGK
ncbi:alpha/beta fold hydrolase [Mycobacterium sp. OTB74]|jgi:pimeloyl-ACP methyl ester carboxylesterase|uniref:alpha/beta fold hydrolase n=1 Tax=Mycobacterium sp. OTB74 TaxID=1853452 RepID=UPI002473EA62|nr:alpha/beta fold hydrolase [Mycobacterium sp. OTB74]MDH6247144.1 pimeloyl-ACP methyl ester carboxylesterase [Mycobacterium sp. OTB74]